MNKACAANGFVCWNAMQARKLDRGQKKRGRGREEKEIDLGPACAFLLLFQQQERAKENPA